MPIFGVEHELINLVGLFLIAAAVGVFIAKVGRFPYTIALLLAGFGASISGIGNRLGIPLSHDIILFLLLPPLIFEGAVNTELDQFRRNIIPIVILAVIGLLVSTVILGLIGTVAFGFPLLVALLFAAMVLPTDPVSVLALFKELGVPDRLAILVEGESLLNDGTGIVLYTIVLSLFATHNVTTTTLGDLLTFNVLSNLAVQTVYVSLGGAFVGLAAGYAVYRVMLELDEHMTETVLALILAYGSFLVADYYFHVSGVIACVVAGLFIGNRGAENAMGPETKISIFNTFETAGFLANTFIFIMIGVRTPLGQFAQYADLILVAIPLVLIARAVGVYPIIIVLNQFTDTEIDWNYQHILWWGGLHGSIPIALVLGLPSGIPYRSQIRILVFGVAAFSLIVQGFTMKPVLDSLNIATRSDAEQLYELLTGRLRAVDEALDAVTRLQGQGEIPRDVAEEFEQEYTSERERLGRTIAMLHDRHPELRAERKHVGERRILVREKTGVMDVMRRGLISDDVGEELIREINLKIDTVEGGGTTIADDGGEYDEFWERRAREFGIDPAEVAEQSTDD